MRRFQMLSFLLVIATLIAACGSTPATTTSTQTAAVVAANTSAPVQPTTVATTVAAATTGVAATTAASVTDTTTTVAMAATTTVPATPKPTPVPKPTVNTLTIKLKSGLKWSDGTALTAQDVASTYDLYWATQNGAWSYLNDVVAKDPTTVEFQLNTPSLRAQRLFLRSFQTAPRSQYAKWMDQAHQLRQQNADPDRDEVKKLVDDLNAFKPKDAVVYGPFKIDPASITEAQMELVKNPTGYNADKISIDKVIEFYGETAASVPLVLSNAIDYSTHGYTPSDLASFEKLPNIEIIHGPTGTGPGLWFNESVYPLGKKEVRQAFAYVIDRVENAKVSLGEGAKAIKNEAGFTDLQVDSWMSKDAISKLNPYNHDLKKAEALLTGIGFKKGADGTWVDDKGKPLQYELSVPSDFADWLGSAENAAQQLTNFGIKTTVRGYQSSERSTTQKEGKYQILMDLSIYYNPPFPFTSFNYYLNKPRNNPEATNNQKGMNWPWKQTDPDGKQVNIPDLLLSASKGFDPAQQKPYVEQLSRIVNDQLPVLALFERYATDPVDTKTRITGWLPLTDKVYQNNQGADNYIAIQMLNGQLKPVDGSEDKSFRTSYPYPQPPNYDLNFFTENSMQQNVGDPAAHLLYPPFFWYMLADQKYVPVVAESFELK